MGTGWHYDQIVWMVKFVNQTALLFFSFLNGLSYKSQISLKWKAFWRSFWDYCIWIELWIWYYGNILWTGNQFFGKISFNKQIICIHNVFYGKLGVVRVLTSQWGFTRLSSIHFSLGIVRDIVPLFLLLRSCLNDVEEKRKRSVTDAMNKWNSLGKITRKSFPIYSWKLYKVLSSLTFYHEKEILRCH